jgi:hypothetical protein
MVSVQPRLCAGSLFLFWGTSQSSESLSVVRVRWIDHKCKVNSDEFDEEESYLQVRQV